MAFSFWCFKYFLIFPTGNFTVSVHSWINRNFPLVSLFSKSLGSSLQAVLLIWHFIAEQDIFLCSACFDQRSQFSYLLSKSQLLPSSGLLFTHKKHLQKPIGLYYFSIFPSSNSSFSLDNSSKGSLRVWPCNTNPLPHLPQKKLSKPITDCQIVFPHYIYMKYHSKRK